MSSCFTHLPNIQVETKSFQCSFQQHLLWQLATGIKDDIALNAGLHVLMCHTQLVVARLCGVVIVCGDIHAMQCISNLLGEPNEVMIRNNWLNLSSWVV